MQYLNYRMFGKGHPVLFLHGFLESISMWNYLDLESINRQIILVDLPGHGASHLLDGEPSIHAMSLEVVKLIEYLKLEKPDVVGHSMGGYIGLELKNLGHARMLTLLNSNFWEDSEEKKRDRIRVAELVLTHKNHFIQEAIPGLFSNRDEHQKEIDGLIQEARLMDPVAIAYAALAMRSRIDWSNVIDVFAEDLTIIQGAQDAVVPIQLMEEKRPKKSNYYLIAEAGHMSHIEATNQVNIILKDTTQKTETN